MSEKDKEPPRAGGKRVMMVRPESWEKLRQAAMAGDVLPDPTQFEVREIEGRKFFRLKESPWEPEGARGGGKIPPFTLKAGDGGAMIYPGALHAAVSILRCKVVRVGIGLVPMGRIIGAAAVPPTSVMVPEEIDVDLPEGQYQQLDWWGEVWLVWELDLETFELERAYLAGADGPPHEIRIPELPESFERTMPEGETCWRYAQRIGSVYEGAPVEQQTTGNFPWFPMIVDGEPDASSSVSRDEESSEDEDSDDEDPSDDSSEPPDPEGPGCCPLVVIEIQNAVMQPPCFEVPAFPRPLQAVVSFEVSVTQSAIGACRSDCRGWEVEVYLDGGKPYLPAGFYGDIGRPAYFSLNLNGEGTSGVQFLVPNATPCQKLEIIVKVATRGAADPANSDAVANCPRSTAPCEKKSEIQLQPWCGSTCDPSENAPSDD